MSIDNMAEDSGLAKPRERTEAHVQLPDHFHRYLAIQDGSFPSEH